MTDADRTEARRRYEKAGRRAEWLAAIVLILKGYRLLARRFRAHGGEIDIVARRGDVVIFAEVKSRRDLDAAVSAVSAQSRRRIERAADMFMTRRPHLADCAMRYDIVAIAAGRWRHMRGAWRYGE